VNERCRRVGGAEVQTGARVQDVAHDQADRQRERRHHQEVAQCQHADLADLGRLRDRADAKHDRAEDDRRDHHLDQVHETVAERFQALGETGCGEAHHDAERHRDEHGEVQVVRLVAAGRRPGVR